MSFFLCKPLFSLLPFVDFVEEPNCELCEIPLEVYNIPAASKDARKVADRGEPCILIDDPEFKRYNYNYSFLKDFYYKNKDELDFSVCEVFGDEGDMKLSDFFKSSEEDILDSRQTFGWYVDFYLKPFQDIFSFFTMP